MGISAAFFSSPAGRPVGRAIHARAIARQERNQSLATSFFRNVRQLSAFEGPLADIPAAGRMRVLVAACSIGCEAYTLSGYLAARHPAIDVAIDAFDIDPDAVDVARKGRYEQRFASDGAFSGPYKDVAAATLDRDGDGWRVLERRRDAISFDTGDALAEEPQAANRYDVVLAQNFMVHMDDVLARKALANLAGRVRPGGAMFLSGVMLDIRARAAAAAGLAPVDWSIREIHEEDTVRRNAWPFTYWSLEPFDPGRSDWRERYATIFRKR